MKHDIESYIITIRRKGNQSTEQQSVAPTAPRIRPLVHEASGLHDPQADYHHGSGVSESLTEVTAPLPGIIVALKVKAGDIVSEGQELAVLEAMKMENSIESPGSGTVRSVNAAIGDSVSEGTVIMIIE